MSEKKPQPKPYDRDALNDFSRRYADFIFARHPEWVQYASNEIEDSDKPAILNIKVPNPSGDPESELFISTHADEVTCYFDRDHSHFSVWDENDVEAETFKYSDEWITELMDEKLIIVIYYKDGKIRSTSQIGRDQTPNFKSDQMGYSKSWRGTYDKQYGIGGK